MPIVQWEDGETIRSAWWQSESGAKPPRRIVPVDDTLTADTAFRLASEGTGLLWHGDFQNARQLLHAMTRRLDKAALDKRKKAQKKAAGKAPPSPVERFNLVRMARAQRARTLNMLLIPVEADYQLVLRRARDIGLACREAWGEPPAVAEVEGTEAPQGLVVSLRELLGVIGAHEWRIKGVAIPALGPPYAHIHPHYGVFSPVRGEYLDLLAKAPLPETMGPDFRAFDIGTGTGVIAALLARRGVPQVVGTENDARALACARENIARLVLNERVDIVEADLFPPGKADLIVCNPPWVPARPSAPIERAIYDDGGAMLNGFLQGLAAHLNPDGQAWLILSDIAEHLGLRTREELLAAFEAAGLKPTGRANIKPRHAKASDQDDPLYAARSAEVTSLWQLVLAE